MLRSCGLSLVLGSIVLTAGCGAGAANTAAWSPFGQTRVAAPATGSYGKPGTPYFSSTQPAGAGTVVQPASVPVSAGVPGRFQASATTTAPRSGWRTPNLSTSPVAVGTGVRKSTVVRAGHTTPAGASTDTGSLQINRMHVNDATTVTAPQAVQPAGYTAPIPALPTTPVAVQPATPTPASATTVVAPAASTTRAIGADDASSLRWRAKYVPAAASGKSGR